MKWLAELIHWKDTRKDSEIGAGEGLDPIQVADDSSDDILKIEDTVFYIIIGVTLTQQRQHIQMGL